MGVMKQFHRSKKGYLVRQSLVFPWLARWLFSSLAVGLLFFACKSRELTPAGERVQIVERKDLGDDCEAIGKIAQTKWIGGCAGSSCPPLPKLSKDAKVWLRNAGAELGAEKVVVTQFKRNPNTPNEVILKGYGFNCP